MNWRAYAESAVHLASSSPLPSQCEGTLVGTQTEGGHQETFPHLKCHPPGAPHRGHKAHLYLQKVEAGCTRPPLPTPFSPRERLWFVGSQRAPLRGKLLTSYHTGRNRAVCEGWEVPPYVLSLRDIGTGGHVTTEAVTGMR